VIIRSLYALLLQMALSEKLVCFWVRQWMLFQRSRRLSRVQEYETPHWGLQNCPLSKHWKTYRSRYRTIHICSC
jgi:hypothetical protein